MGTLKDTLCIHTILSLAESYVSTATEINTCADYHCSRAWSLIPIWYGHS